MQERVRRFHELSQQHLGGRRGRGVRYPEPLRREATALAREALVAGVSLSGVAASLGIGALTLSRWLQSSDRPASLRKVEILESSVASREGHSAGVVVVTPGGYRVEGLTVSQVAELLRTLG